MLDMMRVVLSLRSQRGSVGKRKWMAACMQKVPAAIISRKTSISRKKSSLPGEGLRAERSLSSMAALKLPGKLCSSASESLSNDPFLISFDWRIDSSTGRNKLRISAVDLK